MFFDGVDEKASIGKKRGNDRIQRKPQQAYAGQDQRQSDGALEFPGARGSMVDAQAADDDLQRAIILPILLNIRIGDRIVVDRYILLSAQHENPPCVHCGAIPVSIVPWSLPLVNARPGTICVRDLQFLNPDFR